MRKGWSAVFGLAALLALQAAGDEPSGAPKAPGAYPAGELGEMVKLGEAIINETDTHPLTKGLVGNTLKCRNCHLAGSDGRPGTAPGLGTFMASATSFPAYSKREGSVVTLQQRIDQCFSRSMDGKEPLVDTRASMAMTAYVTWLSTGIPVQLNAQSPMSPYNSETMRRYKTRVDALLKEATHAQYLEGEKVYRTKCAACHQADGSGIMGAFPALWGKTADGKWRAYNAGAGMSKLDKAAIWIHSNMPYKQGGTLSLREAVSVALFVDAQPREAYPPAWVKQDNAAVRDTVRDNFKTFGLDVDAIRGDKKVP